MERLKIICRIRHRLCRNPPILAISKAESCPPSRKLLWQTLHFDAIPSGREANKASYKSLHQHQSGEKIDAEGDATLSQENQHRRHHRDPVQHQLSRDEAVVVKDVDPLQHQREAEPALELRKELGDYLFRIKVGG